MKKLYIFFSVLILLFIFNSTASMAEKLGSVEKNDLSFNGISLGDDASVLQEILGEPMFDTEMTVFGVEVIRYTYPKDVTVCVTRKDNKVADILLGERALKKYIMRNNIRWGSMKAALAKAYGKAEHENVDGHIFYIYRYVLDTRQKIVIELDYENAYLISWRATSLPANENEAFEFRPENSIERGWDSDRFDFLDDVSKGEIQTDAG